MLYELLKMIATIIRILNFLNKNFGKKRFILDRHKKNLSIILDKLFWTYPLWLGHVLFDQA
jgi:hypothetical protein